MYILFDLVQDLKSELTRRWLKQTAKRRLIDRLWRAVLVEKLLRCCPGIKNLYLLIRPKSGNDIRTRLEELITVKVGAIVWLSPRPIQSGYSSHNLNNDCCRLLQVFDNLRRYSPDPLVPIAGDMSMPGLGVSSSDIKILSDNVSIVFHSAATVEFDEANTRSWETPSRNQELVSPKAAPITKRSTAKFTG